MFNYRRKFDFKGVTDINGKIASVNLKQDVDKLDIDNLENTSVDSSELIYVVRKWSC